MKNGKTAALSPEMLSGINAFRRLNASDRQAVVRHCQSRYYAPGQFIASSGERRSEVYFIVAGKVQVAVFSESGQQITLQELAAGEMFGEVAAIDGAERSADVIALTEVLLASVSARDYWMLMLRYPCIAQVTLARLSHMVRLLCSRVVQVSSLSSRCRLQAELLDRAKASADNPNIAIISPAPKHSEIANYIGIRRETVTRELSRLRRFGLIEKRGCDLVLPDVAGLDKLLKQAAGW